MGFLILVVHVFAIFNLGVATAQVGTVPPDQEVYSPTGQQPESGDDEVESPIGEVNPEILPPETLDANVRAEAWKAKIIESLGQKKNKQAMKQASAFVAWLEKTDNKELAAKYLPLALESKATAQENLGLYGLAIRTLEKAFELTQNKKYVTDKVDLEKKLKLRSKLFNMNRRFQVSQLDRSKQLAQTAKQRLQVIQDFKKEHSAKNPATPEEMKALRQELKKLADQKKEIREKMTAEKKKIWKEHRDFVKAGVRLNGNQRDRLGAIAQAADRRFQTTVDIEKKIRKNVLNISEDYRMTWPGLEDTLNRLTKAQEKILGLQQEFLKASKEDQGKKQDEIAQALKNYERLMEQVEDTFMTSEAFRKFTPEEQQQFLKAFRALENKDAAVQKNAEKIDAILKDILPQGVIGDLNHDGQVDEKDLAEMDKLVGFFPIHKDEVHYRKGFDLDDNGILSHLDFQLMHQAVMGDRKYFPIDPRIQQGDIDGDGELDMEDVRRMSNHISWWGAHPNSALTKVSDMDGDGRLTIKDLPALIEKAGLSKDLPADADFDINQDGVADAKDLMKIMEMVAHPNEYFGVEMKRKADLNKDGKVSIEDVVLASQLAKVGPEPQEPQDQPVSETPSEPVSTDQPQEPAAEPTADVQATEQPTQLDNQETSDSLIDR
jgi:hypothetical protein